LVKAELQDLTHKKDKTGAISKYERAIQHAGVRGWIHDEASAEQRFSEFWLRENDNEAAKTHMLRSIELYETWGAKAKSDQLRGKYSDLLS